MGILILIAGLLVVSMMLLLWYNQKEQDNYIQALDERLKDLERMF